MSRNITVSGTIHNWYNAPVYRDGRKSGGSRKCYNCDGRGHLSRNCSKPRTNGGGRGGRGMGSRGVGGRGNGGVGGRGSGGVGGRGCGGRGRRSDRERDDRGSQQERQPSSARSISRGRSRSRSPIPRRRSRTISIQTPTPTTNDISNKSFDDGAMRCTESRTEAATCNTD